MFRRTLTPFCPSAALAEIGAYVARDAALTPIVAIRGADGVARAFRNACRHRGVQLVDGTGCKKALTCRYHGWTYGLDVRLRGIPDDYGFPGLDKTTHGLVPVTCIKGGGLGVRLPGRCRRNVGGERDAGLVRRRLEALFDRHAGGRGQLEDRRRRIPRRLSTSGRHTRIRSIRCSTTISI